MRPKPGDVIGSKYRIVRLIGDGGMGAVYEARHEVLGTAVALKFLHSDLAKRQGLAARFKQEAQISASIQSPHVVRVTDVDSASDGSPYLVMELLSGETMQALMDRQKKLSVDQAIDFALQTLSGLEAAHALGVVHRDLKPDNIFITPATGGPLVKLIDFGIAKLRASSEYTRGLTRAGVLMGTPEYMAPEQVYSADKVDHRADLYSLGAILYETLSGRRPADGEDPQVIIAQVLSGSVPRLTEIEPTLLPELADVVHKALEPEKERRYASAMEMRLALAPFAKQLSHAGRLAATPAPVSVIPSPQEGQNVTRKLHGVLFQSQPARQQEAARAEQPPSADVPKTDLDPPRGVPATLPPEGPSGEQPLSPDYGQAKGATVGVAPEVIQQNIASHTQASDVGQSAQSAAAAHQAVGQSAQSAGQSAMASPFGHSPSFSHSPSAVYNTAQYGPPVRRKPRRALGPVIALLLGAAITGGVIFAVAVQRKGSTDSLPPLVPAQDSGVAPATTITAQGGEPEPPPTVPPVTGEPVTPGRPRQGPAPRADGGTRRADAGTMLPFPQFPMPSGLPPLPSGFPTALPSGFPQIPGLTPPQQPPANVLPRDAGR